ncbi:MAG: VCBS repeat-containing protein, partial [Candidatus Eisenbacteria sp.]|nr:VCBS repeat-containing protein [Candidatus Eisenbacteria bacterium]
IESWIANYGKMPFAFVGSCGGMCDTGNNSLSFEFRKGSSFETTTVGYCNMAAEFCGDCWNLSIHWQTALFGYMNEGYTVKAAHDQANADYPQCGVPECMRFAGDPTFVVVPPVARLGAPWTDETHPTIADASRGAGVAWGDYDGDGDLDIYLANSDSDNKLFSYIGGGVFVDLTVGSLGDTGAGTAVASADYDNDGDLDIYLVNADGPNRLFANDGAGWFSDVAAGGPLADSGAGYGASWADFDNDGYVDLYIVNDGPNRLLRNNGPPTWTFADVTLPPLDDVRRGRTAAWADYDDDGDQDLYLTRAGYTSRLFRNEGAGVFTDATVPAIADSGITMGAAWGDYDND